VASLLALITWLPSAEKMASLTYDVCPRNSLSILPDLRPWTRTVPSNDPLSTCDGGGGSRPGEKREGRGIEISLLQKKGHER
jgi:hypothetical protein